MFYIQLEPHRYDNILPQYTILPRVQFPVVHMFTVMGFWGKKNHCLIVRRKCIQMFCFRCLTDLIKGLWIYLYGLKKMISSMWFFFSNNYIYHVQCAHGESSKAQVGSSDQQKTNSCLIMLAPCLGWQPRWEPSSAWSSMPVASLQWKEGEVWLPRPLPLFHCVAQTSLSFIC